MDTQSEPQKRKRCDSDNADTATDGFSTSITKKRLSTARPTIDSPASPIMPTCPTDGVADDDSPESPADAAAPVHLESPDSPTDSPASPDAETPATATSSGSGEDGELIDASTTDDCLIVDKTIPVVVLDSDDLSAVDAPPNDDNDDCQILDKTVPLVVLDNDMDADVAVAAPQPLMRIRFRDAATGVRLQSVVQQAIRTALFRQQIAVDATMAVSDTNTGELELIVTECAAPGQPSSSSATGQPPIGACNFMVDAAPSEDTRSRKASADVPQYSVNVAAVFDPTTLHAPVASDDSGAASARPKNVCFNCDGDHQMRDCTQPRNAQKIRENRQNFGGGAGRQERYHVDANQKFAHLEAGRVGDELRRALGLRAGDLPMHVYRMRVLGYPPGWLEAAKVSGSGLALFDDKGNEMAGGSSRDEGADARADEIEYDLKRIISYPGYNVEPEKGTYDISYNLRLPPMREHQSRAVMLQNLRARSTKSYKRQKHIKNIPIADACADTSQIDLSNPTMDLDADDADDAIVVNPPVPGGAPQMAPPPPPPPPPSTPRPASPTMDDLRQQQEKLLAALDDSVQSIDASTAASSVADDSLIDDILALDQSTQSIGGGDDDSLSMTAPPPENGASPAASTPMNSSKHSMSGTPLLQSASPYTELPAGPSWSVGVSDVIDFENLADSTGKFQRMKGLIQKVRVAVKQLNDEYDT